VINFGLLFLLNTGIEVAIVRRMKKELREKRARMTNMNATANSSVPALTSAASSTVLSDKKREDDEMKERRVIKMVVLNSVLNLILRAPDLLFWIENRNVLLLLIQSFLLDDSQPVPGLLSLVADIGYFTYILTFTTNFFIFYHFNTKFKEAVVFSFINIYTFIKFK
jgi:hypothetical protein